MEQEQSQGAYLLIQQGSLAGKRLELWKNITTIGRSRDSDIFLEDVTVHRKQASIIQTPDGYLLKDDHGSGDSLVNKKSVTQCLLQSGDELSFGQTRMIFYANEGTRPFQLPSSRGKELYLSKTAKPQPIAIARLHFNNLHSITSSIELQPGMTIGRSRDCDIFIEDLAVSRLHATIEGNGTGGYEIIDNQSAMGTLVNGRPIVRQTLQEGDVIQVGRTRLTFTITNS
jgi:pSer/pThr/pTyr-binding forkhead associated (FHA) protein